MGLALASGERIAELLVTCHPSLTVLRSAYSIVSLWAAHQGAGDLGAVNPDHGEAALVLRQGLDVLVLRLPPGRTEFRRGGPAGGLSRRRRRCRDERRRGHSICRQPWRC